MVEVIRIRKGLDIRLRGKADGTKVLSSASSALYALQPSDFVGVVPKLTVKEGDSVKAGSPLFVNKAYPSVSFPSPVSGRVVTVKRGERRKIEAVIVEADGKDEAVDFGIKDPLLLGGGEVLETLLQSGLFGFIRQLPYAISALPAATPKAIFVSALRDMPLAADFEVELQGQESVFQCGLDALSRLAPVHLGIGVRQQSTALREAKHVTVTAYDGPCPAGNVGVQVNRLAPVNKGEVVWTADPTVVIFIGRLFAEGRVDLRRIIALAGSEVAAPAYYHTVVGAGLASLLDGKISGSPYNRRIINGNVLTGKADGREGFLGALTSEIAVIPEGDDVDEAFGWIMPRVNQFSVSRSYFSWLCGKKEYAPDARIKGGKRHCIMSGEYDKVFPMDILPEYLIKAIIAGDIDKMEELGIYEVAPEDFALAEFVCSSKMELQRIVREGLDMLRKEEN
ncbi:MAG: Na(+)-translocating NADH-quinone reductase subunit A [Prevotella sp.]